VLSVSDTFRGAVATSQPEIAPTNFRDNGLPKCKETCVGFWHHRPTSFQIFFCFIISTMLTVSAVAQEVKPAGSDAKAVVTESARKSTAALLPATTRFWVSIEDLNRMETNIANTQLGKLSRQDALAPFFSSFEKQMREALNSNGIKFGIDVAAVEGMETGEIAIAGILPDFAPGEKPKPKSHGIVVLIDVSPDIEAANVFLKAAAKKMEARGAKQKKVTLLDTEVSKWSITVKGQKIAREQSSFVTVIDGWLFASDNESIFTNVLRRIKMKDQQPKDSLLKREPFITVREKTRVAGVKADLAWFVDPLGYARFADAMAEDNADISQPKDRPLEALAKEGFDALEAAGGFVSFSTGKHDVLHRSLVYANREKSVERAHRRLFELLDFAPEGWTVAQAPKWIPADAAGYFTVSWDVGKAFENVGPLVDAVSGKKGTFDGVLEEMKKVPKFRVDIRKMMQSMGKRISIIVRTEQPISEASEKMLVGIELNKGVDQKWLIESIGRAVQGKVKKLAGISYVIDDRTKTTKKADPTTEIIIDIEDDEEEEIDIADPKEAAPRITIFNRRFMLIKDDVLYICNDKDYLKKIISRKSGNQFQVSPDYARMTLALKEFSDDTKVRFRMFNRLDQMLKTNYEMMRTGRMAESETLVARVLNRVYGRKADGDNKRIQQIDGSDLPADYEKEIAPSLGQSGWVMETTDSGWRFSGCVLPKTKKKEMEKQK